MPGPAAGVQIKKWFVTLIALIFFLDGVGMVGLFLMRSSIRTIAEEAQPLITTAEEINRGILETRVILYRYLSENLDSPGSAMGQLESVRTAAGRGLSLARSQELKGAFDTIGKQAQQYGLVISSLPDSSQGSIDWGSINELTTKAREVSDAMLLLSGEVKAQSQQEIDAAISAAQKVAAATTTLFLGFLVVSLVIVAMMLYWWRKFQEMILDLKPMREMRPIGEIVARLLAGMGAAEVLPYASIRAAWKTIVGPDLSRVCRPDTLSGGTLTVVVSHPTWVQHLVFLKETLLANVRREVPGSSVTAVVFRVGRMQGEKRAAETVPARAPLSAGEEQAIEQAIAGVKDEEIRDCLRSALRSALAAAPDRFTAGAADAPRS